MGCEILAKAALALSRSCPNLRSANKREPFHSQGRFELTWAVGQQLGLSTRSYTLLQWL